MARSTCSKNTKICADTYYDKKSLEAERAKYHEACMNELFECQLNNFLWNMPLIQCTNYPGILGFRDIFKRYPAVVVGAGPSLDKHGAMLKEARSRIIIVACDAALPVLVRKYDVYPHFVVMVDPTAKQKKNFDDIDTTKFYTIVPPIVHPSIFRAVDPHHLAVYNLKGTDNKLFDMAPYHIGRRGAMPSSVLTTGSCFCFSTVLGCDPVIFVGQDLCWKSTEKVYASGIEEWKVNFQKGAKFRGNCMLFPDIHGKLVLTHQTMVMFWAWMRDNTRLIRTRVVNASEAGILGFKGMRQMRFDSVLKRYAAKELVGVEDAIKKAYNDRYGDGLIEELLLPPFKSEYKAMKVRMVGKEVK